MYYAHILNHPCVFNPLYAKSDYTRFYYTLLADQITAMRNKMSVDISRFANVLSQN